MPEIVAIYFPRWREEAPRVRASCSDGMDPQGDLRLLNAIARWCNRFSPLCAVDGCFLDACGSTGGSAVGGSAVAGGAHAPSPLFYGVFLDCTGCRRLYRDFSTVMFTIAKKFSDRKCSVRIVTAPTVGAAWAVSRYGMGACATLAMVDTVAPEQLSAVLDPLPPAALRISDALVQKLRALGITTLAELRRLPRDGLGTRYGKELSLRMAQAWGKIPELFCPPPPLRRWRESKIFEPPLERHEQIVEALSILISRLDDRTRREGLWFDAVHCTVVLLASDRSRVRLHHKLRHELRHELRRELRREIHHEFRVARRPTHLRTILRSVVERMSRHASWHEGEVYELSVTAMRVQRQERWQLSVDEPDSCGEDCGERRRAGSELLALLDADFGRERIVTGKLLQSHIPERASSYQPYDGASDRSARNRSSRNHSASCSLHTKGKLPTLLQERPNCFFRSPLPIAAIALMPDSPPSSITWDGERLKIIASVGPRRVSEAWWEAPPVQVFERDYFAVQDERGRWLWVYREVQTASHAALGSHRWFVQGLWA